MNWHSIYLPTGSHAVLPADINLSFVDDPTLTPQQRCATSFIPWDANYLEHIPKQYQEFFTFVLPHLGNRTTNVHTALSVSQLDYLLTHAHVPANERIVYLATILHDTGWSKVTHQGIAHSLSYSGVAPTSPASFLPKQQHVLIGAALAYDILDDFDFSDWPISEADKRSISRIIRRHDYDAAWDRGKFPELSIETKLVCDADRLWSFTHENFWQDTVRKDIRPSDYLTTITNAVDTYFITPQGKQRARDLIAERQPEVTAYGALLGFPIRN